MRSLAYVTTRAWWLSYVCDLLKDGVITKQEHDDMCDKCKCECTCKPKLDLTKPMQTRDGRPARYIGRLNQSANDEPLVFAVQVKSGREIAVTRLETGHYYRPGTSSISEHHNDIINVPEKKVRAVHYRNHQLTMHKGIALKFTCEITEDMAKELGYEYEPLR